MADEDSDDRSEYTVEINGVPHTMLLTPEAAEAYGDAATKSGAKARGAGNKAKTPENK